MTPLDHELRSALARRAASLNPSPDPLAGIERRASRIHRRRTLSAVLGAAVAVTAIAVGVPAVTGGDRADGPSRFATDAPSPPASSYALDPRAPWPMRGTPIAEQPSYQRAWQAKHPGSTLTPLFGQRYEPSGRDEEAFIATGPSGSRYGWFSSTADGPVLLVDQPYDGPTAALQFPLPGDEVPRLVVVTTPAATEVGYAADGMTFRDITVINVAAVQPALGVTSGAPVQRVAPGRVTGIGVTPIEGAAAIARLRVTVGNGQIVYAEPARAAATSATTPSPAALPTTTPSAVPTTSPTPSAPPAPSLQPTNLLAWPNRGAAPRPADVAALEKAFALSLGRGSAAAAYRPLHSDLTESGVRYTVGQAWIPGDSTAYDVSWAQDRTNPPVFHQWAATPASPSALAFVLRIASTFSSDLLVVIPRPGVGQVSYSPDANTAFSAVASGRSDLNAVALVPRAAGQPADRLEVLRGDGNASAPLYRGPVTGLLCGAASCP